jgi:hypothetical protein
MTTTRGRDRTTVDGVRVCTLVMTSSLRDGARVFGAAPIVQRIDSCFASPDGGATCQHRPAGRSAVWRAADQQITQFALKHKCTPVGSGVMPDAEVTFLLSYLMGGPEGRAEARKIDAKIDSLPGLAGLHILERALDKHAVPA